MSSFIALVLAWLIVSAIIVKVCGIKDEKIVGGVTLAMLPVCLIANCSRSDDSGKTQARSKATSKHAVKERPQEAVGHSAILVPGTVPNLQSDSPNTNMPTLPSSRNEKESVALSAAIPPITTGRLCATAIGQIMGRDPSIIKVRYQDGYNARVMYVRPDDRVEWWYDCWFDDKRILWRSVEANRLGRWRDQPGLDEYITYTPDQYGAIVTVNGQSTRMR